jgi:hypothetical protein
LNEILLHIGIEVRSPIADYPAELAKTRAGTPRSPDLQRVLSKIQILSGLFSVPKLGHKKPPYLGFAIEYGSTLRRGYSGSVEDYDL